MPQKSAARTWGTRFDTLPSSPPPSPQTREAALVEDTHTTSTSGNNPDASNAKKIDKMPHDASVFVGSLPTNIEQSELSRLLSEHLSEHAEVRSIKLVKDSKGGVCAFVQCENAAEASSLINTLHSNAPKHFLGRVLRYEPARAFRTLLISYRTPMQFISSGDRSKGGGENIQLDPPLAMRLWRPRNSKFLSLLYNTEAVDAENHSNTVRDPASDPGLFLQPVVFDEGTIRMLSAHFGPLEFFGLFKGSNAANDTESTKPVYPPPHDGPRLSEMNAGCFEVKWAHRDDCVSALMTLRRVPHLTVTWAHQPAPFGYEQHHGRFAPNHTNNGTSYPFHVQNFTPPSQPRNEPVTASPGTSQSPPCAAFAVGQTSHGNTSSDVSFSVCSTNTDDWKRISPVQSYDSSASFRSPGFLDASPTRSRVGWTDIDFPPLGDTKADRRAEQGVWADKKIYKGIEGEGRERPPSSLSVVISDANSAMMHRDSNAASYQDEEQELDIPDTPGLGMSPITPKTSGSQFPTTPTSANDDLHSSSFQGYESKEKNGYFEATKELDPTTLFVGGLEMYGPGAWDEDRVSALFGRFGGLESVKVVRPLNGRAAFAFVKFDNTESPARAVFEEHNRVHDGRAMRVQLRDCNPPRSSNWRYAGRPRGRFSHSHYGSQRRYPEDSEQAHEPPTSEFHPDDSGPTDEVGEMVSLSLDDDKSVQDPVCAPAPADFAVTSFTEEEPLRAPPQPREDHTQSCPASRRPSPEPASVPEAPPQPEYREWYDEPASATMTPPLPSLNSSAAVPGAPYSTPGGGYYPPTWTQSYHPQQMPYGVPYYPGFPGYPVHGPQPPSQPYSSPGGSDASGPASVPPRPWPSMGMYGAYVSYPAYPARPPNTDQSSPRSQAPLQPTGFIQNEQGTLIPVYQPEALDQYMASNQATPTTTSVARPATGTATWQPFPPPPSHAFPNPIHPMMGMPPRAFPAQAQASVNVGWVPGQFLPPPPHSHAAQPPNVPNHPTNFRGGYQDMTGPNGRRHPGRRDQHLNAGNNNRNNPGRPMPNRHPRGGMQHMGYPPHEGVQQMQHLSRPTQFNSGPADWNQWTVTR
ncbi:hypothetical protein B0H17DRAFT_135636 [Mycena rosella]|uniref:RRM domain-containing protein n=1 Tax=Mycena rosella TaxID=1033263 RepID=A0AAD7D2D0_MYCRO|nr:hypothetical protein B0H17DRAFT_135636 [Mycena rosella]